MGGCLHLGCACQLQCHKPSPHHARRSQSPHRPHCQMSPHCRPHMCMSDNLLDRHTTIRCSDAAPCGAHSATANSYAAFVVQPSSSRKETWPTTRRRRHRLTMSVSCLSCLATARLGLWGQSRLLWMAASNPRTKRYYAQKPKLCLVLPQIKQPYFIY